MLRPLNGLADNQLCSNLDDKTVKKSAGISAQFFMEWMRNEKEENQANLLELKEDALTEDATTYNLLPHHDSSNGRLRLYRDV